MNTVELELQTASRLRAAYAGDPIEPFSAAFAGSVEAAYRIQNINTQHAVEVQGRSIVGRKIGLTSVAVQKQLGVDQPDFGVLFADMRIEDSRNDTVAGLLQPKIEAEIAFGFSRDVTDADLDVDGLVACIDWIAPALEVVDSRIVDWRIGIVETIADNASSGRFVIGSKTAISSESDVVDCEMQLYDGDRVVSSGSGAACLGNPFIATLWLARKMVKVGRPIRAGELVLSGALGPMVKVQKGHTYRATVGGFGTVSVSFDAPAALP
ncbi:2-keto-4-pentenoate hydratase [Caballeronia sordidicola]|uniref:2-keto-4-pentenoate hydratase n=1 Tax=Caballeronia sordidicola TaxID=196367 RepID=UPI0004D02399|nr:fumarylacetoacetate hydrolase family protein [Caballeronia sordidicola]